MGPRAPCINAVANGIAAETPIVCRQRAKRGTVCVVVLDAGVLAGRVAAVERKQPIGVDVGGRRPGLLAFSIGGGG
jgi:hypothetical protein